MEKTFASNPKARHDFDVVETLEGGLVLSGPEVKAIKHGSANIKGAFVSMRRGELWLKNAYIGPYAPAGKQAENTERRDRKILVHAREIKHLTARHEAERLTMIPLSLYDKKGRVKIAFALARGKRKYEKRDAIKKRELDRESRRYVR